ASDLASGNDDEGNEQKKHPRELSAQRHHNEGNEDQGKKLLEKLRHHSGHGVLHALNVIDDGGEQGAGGVFLEEGGGAAQDGIVKIIAQVRNHAVSSVVH